MKIFEIVSRMKRMNLAEQVHFLRSEIRKEKPFSVRRNELESLLRGKVAKQLKREVSFHRTRSPASAPIGHQEAEIASA